MNLDQQLFTESASKCLVGLWFEVYISDGSDRWFMGDGLLFPFFPLFFVEFEFIVVGLFFFLLLKAIWLFESDTIR